MSVDSPVQCIENNSNKGFQDTEAEESDDGKVTSPNAAIFSGSESDGEDLDRDLPDLINDEPEVSDDDSVHSPFNNELDDIPESIRNKAHKYKKKNRKREEHYLEVDDYDLIYENLGVLGNRRKKYRRVHLSSSDEGEKEIAEKLFTPNDVEEPISDNIILQTSTVKPSIDLDIRSSSEGEDVDDFIVDEQDQPVRRSKSQPTNANVQEAIDIFGAEINFDDLESAGENTSDEDLNDFIDDDTASVIDRCTVDLASRNKLKSKKKGIYEIYDPHEIEEKHLTTRDEEIRVLDIPERYQLRKVPITGAEDYELEQEAKWIYKQVFDEDTISQQDYCTRILNDYVRDLNPNSDLRAQAIIKKIKNALDCIRNRHSDLTFISNYRRELIEPELKFNDLILIYSLDEKWCQLNQHKSSLIKMFNKLATHNVEKIRQHPDAMLNDEIRPLQEEDRQRIEEANSFGDITDVSSHLLLYYSQDIVEMQNIESNQNNNSLEISLLTETGKANEKKSIKMASRRSFFTLCKNSGLNSLASKFGLSPEQFGENMRESYQLNKPEQFPVDPEDAAREYINEKSQFNTPESVLSGARHIVSLQISRDPLIRKCVRHAFRNRSFLSVSPTSRGKKDIDNNHPCFKFKYIKGKPIKDLRNDDVIIIFEAEDHGLLTVKISVDREASAHEHTYLEEIKHLYLRDDFSSLVKKWNDQRILALNAAFQKYLYPLIIKEIRNILKKEAEQYILNQCINKFMFMVNVAPYCSASDKQHEIHSLSSFNESIRDRRVNCNLIAISIFVEDDLPCFAATLNSDGELESFLILRTIHKQNSRDAGLMASKDKDISNLRDLIQRSYPKVIVISANGKLALNVRGELQRILKEFENNDQFVIPSIEFLDPSIPNLFTHSQRSSYEFPDHPPQLRHSISLGRLLQDPLIEYTSLATTEEDLLCLQLHSLQSHCSQDALLESMVFYLSRAVADVGVDFNECLRFKHKSHLLSFVPGLGPRKAGAMLSKLEQYGSLLENRSQLVTICDIGATVFVNCAGFIKIDVEDIGERQTDSYIEELDGSRVHPETYEWAKRMAVDALEYDDTEEDFDSKEAVQKIIRNPEKLQDLDLDAFAVQLEKENFGDKRATLNDIRNELENGCYKDRRIPFKRLVGSELFELLFGERMSNDDLKVISRGKLVVCQVFRVERKKPTQDMLSNAEMDRNDQTGMWMCPFCKRADFSQVNHVWNHFDEEGCPGQPIGISVKLNNGLIGFIHLKNLSSVPVSNPEERVTIGMSITCRILKVNYDKFSLELSCKSSDLQDLDGIYAPIKDKYFDSDEQINDTRTQNEVKQVIQNFTKRVVIHPKFKNLTYNESLPLLQRLSIGDCIIRPSSRGADHLTLTWKIENDLYHHIDIRESNKQNSFSLGKSLWIDDIEYEDLDEILATYFAKLVSNAREIQNHKCYRKANGGEIPTLEALLTEERKSNPSRIPYIFSPCKKYPGKFILAFTPKNKPQVAYITIVTEGFRLRGQVYKSLAFLLKWFKEHYIEFGHEVATPMAALIASPAVSHQHLTPRNTRDALGALTHSLHNTPTPLLTPGGGVMQLGYPTPNAYHSRSAHDNFFSRLPEGSHSALSYSK